MTATIAAEMGEVARGSTHYHALFGIGIILFVLTFLINLAADLFQKRSQALTHEPADCAEDRPRRHCWLRRFSVVTAGGGHPAGHRRHGRASAINWEFLTTMPHGGMKRAASSRPSSARSSSRLGTIVCGRAHRACGRRVPVEYARDTAHAPHPAWPSSTWPASRPSSTGCSAWGCSSSSSASAPRSSPARSPWPS